MLAQIEGIEIVGEAQDVPQAFDCVRTLRPDAVILDIQMPGGSGIDVLRELKHNYPSIVTIVLTNHPSLQYQQKCAELGVDYFVIKSIGLSRLLEICERLAARKAFDG